MNRRPDDYKSTALPTELHRLISGQGNARDRNRNITETPIITQGKPFIVQGSRFNVQCPRFRVEGLGFRIQRDARIFNRKLILRASVAGTCFGVKQCKKSLQLVAKIGILYLAVLKKRGPSAFTLLETPVNQNTGQPVLKDIHQSL